MNLFVLAVGLTSGLKLFSKLCCKQMHYPGFVVPFVGQRQSRWSIILKGPRIWGIVKEHGLQLKLTSYVSL